MMHLNKSLCSALVQVSSFCPKPTISELKKKKKTSLSSYLHGVNGVISTKKDWHITGKFMGASHLFSQIIPMPVSAFSVLCCLFPSHFLLLCSDTPGSAADGAWPVGVGRQPALARNFQFQLDLTEGGSHYPYTEVGSEKNTPAVS